MFAPHGKSAAQMAWLRAGIAMAALLGAVPAVAQEQPAASTDAPAEEVATGAPEIIVTARRREENVQDVPATIQVVGAEQLIARGIKNELDLQTAVPGLLVRTNNNQFQLNYVMRGESFEPYSGSVPGVQPYLNEVALSGNAAPPFYDLENVQVLKGPQGTLFGRNSTGGAVLYQTRRPGEDFGGFGSFQYGNYNRLIAEAAVDVPIAPGLLAVRLAGTYQDGGAYVRNLYNDTLVGDSTLKSGRITVDFSPGDRFRNTTVVQYSEFDGDNIPKRPSYVAPCGVGASQPCWVRPGNAFFESLISSPQGTYFPGWPNGNVYPGGFPTFIDYLDENGRYTVSANGGGGNSAKDTLVVNTTTLQLDDNVMLKNIFGYSKTERLGATDNDNTPYPFLQTGGNTPGNPQEGRDTRQISNELQLQADAFDDRLNFILGVFYSDNQAEYDSPVTGLSYTPSINFWTVFNLRYRARTTDTSYAAFTQGTYKLTDRLNVTAGVRYAWDDMSILHLPGSTFAGTRKKSTTVDDTSWTFTLDYKASDQLLLYATTRGSWRVGGYNPFVPPGTGGDEQTAETGGNYFPAETVRDIELGFKLDERIGDMPVRLNGDFYYLWAQNIEKTGTTIVNGRVTSATLSVPAGEVWGFDVDGFMRPASWLTIGGNGTVTIGKFTDREAVIFGVPVVYDTFPDSPKFSGSIYADATYEMGDAGALTYHVDLYGQTSFHMTSFGGSFNPGDTIPGYALLNMRLDWADILGAKGITASLFMKNVTDKLYYTGGGGGVQANGTNSVNLGLPRTFGLVLRAEF